MAVPDPPVGRQRERLGPKLRRLLKENPLLMVGIAGTGVCLGGAVLSFVNSQNKVSQYFQRGRVAMQGFTIGILFYTLYSQTKVKEEFRQLGPSSVPPPSSSAAP
eukprot:comp16633_c0_seq1/m.14820 comp16633_c0_seq1/g.14820  ORF comp16633_c0_seq1/g.14820 comp16633_c0_seq1/m.14820 type:complete len:105 (-) comp16633_c0_seq1:363-677(-)